MTTNNNNKMIYYNYKQCAVYTCVTSIVEGQCPPPRDFLYGELRETGTRLLLFFTTTESAGQNVSFFPFLHTIS